MESMRRVSILLIGLLVWGAGLGCCSSSPCPGISQDAFETSPDTGADLADQEVSGEEPGVDTNEEESEPPHQTGECPDSPQYVKAPAGCFKGLIEADVRSFRGIPYAQPPLGELRWKAPQPVEPLEGVYDATRFGPRCVQFMDNGVGITRGTGSEDCLYLNVWTPLRPKTKLPVLVFIHGGGQAIGSGSEPYYWGHEFARHHSILVTLNYRLGVFGYLAHPALTGEDPHHSSGNYAILDIIQALKWVRDNIEAFGGDPDHILVFGESAGAINTCILLFSPLSKGLFNAALMESGSCLYIRQTQGEAESTGKDLAQRLGCETKKDVLACMRSKSVQEILDASKDWFENIFLTPGPHIDGYVLPQAPLILVKNQQFNQVPVVAGANRDDAAAFTYTIPMDETKFKQYMNWWAKQLGIDANALMTTYDPSTYKSPKDAYNHFLTDLYFVCPERSILMAVSGAGVPAFQYEFAYSYPGGYGPVHAAELLFVFGTYPRPEVPGSGAQKLSDTMQKYWINMARQGNPNSTGLPNWPAFTPNKHKYIIFDKTISTAEGWRDKECDFLSKYGLF